MKKLIVLFALIALLSIGTTATALPAEDMIEMASLDQYAAAMMAASEYNVTFAGGYIYDSDSGEGIEGAVVTVNCDGETQTDTTDSNGFYLVTIPCSENDIIQVTATSTNGSGSNSSTVESLGDVTMDMTTINIGVARADITIPEFPIAALPALLSMFSFGLVRKRLF